LRDKKKRGEICTFAWRERKAKTKRKKETITGKKQSIKHHHALHYKKENEVTLSTTR
jgi:hypothetical protein